MQRIIIYCLSVLFISSTLLIGQVYASPQGSNYTRIFGNPRNPWPSSNIGSSTTPVNGSRNPRGWPNVGVPRNPAPPTGSRNPRTPPWWNPRPTPTPQPQPDPAPAPTPAPGDGIYDLVTGSILLRVQENPTINRTTVKRIGLSGSIKALSVCTTIFPPECHSFDVISLTGEDAVYKYFIEMRVEDFHKTTIDNLNVIVTRTDDDGSPENIVSGGFNLESSRLTKTNRSSGTTAKMDIVFRDGVQPSSDLWQITYGSLSLRFSDSPET